MGGGGKGAFFELYIFLTWDVGVSCSPISLYVCDLHGQKWQKVTA